MIIATSLAMLFDLDQDRVLTNTVETTQVHSILKTNYIGW